MSRQNLMLLLLIAWGSAFAWSFFFIQITLPSGSGFTRGLNVIAGFLSWQIGALVLAIIVWIVGARFAKSTSLRRISRGPVLAHILVILGIIVIIVWTLITNPKPGPPVSLTPTVTTIQP